MTDPRVERPLVVDGVFSKTMEAFTTGVVLAGLALHVGAGDLAIGLLAALPPLLQLAQFPALRLIARYRDRRMICVLTAGASRATLLGVAGVALVGPSPWSLLVLVVLYAVQGLFSAISAISWTYWMRDLLPRDELGGIFARRLRYQGIAGIVLLAATGVYLNELLARDLAGLGYSTMFVLGALAGFGGLYYMSRIPNVPLDPRDTAPSLRGVLREVSQRRRDRMVIRFVAAFGFAISLAFPFLGVFMLAELHVSFALVAALSALSIATSILVYPLWGRLSDRYSNKAIMAVALPVPAATMLAATWLTDASWGSIAVLAAIHVLNGAAIAALDIGTSNLILKHAPEMGRGAFLAAASVARAVASGVGALVGGGLAAWFATRALTFSVAWTDSTVVVLTPVRLTHYDFVFLACALSILYTMHRLALVREEGEAAPRVVLRELQMSAQSTSSVVGQAFMYMGSHVSRAILDRRTVRRLDRRAR